MCVCVDILAQAVLVQRFQCECQRSRHIHAAFLQHFARVLGFRAFSRSCLPPWRSHPHASWCFSACRHACPRRDHSDHRDRRDRARLWISTSWRRNRDATLVVGAGQQQPCGFWAYVDETQELTAAVNGLCVDAPPSVAIPFSSECENQTIVEVDASKLHVIAHFCTLDSDGNTMAAKCRIHSGSDFCSMGCYGALADAISSILGAMGLAQWAWSSWQPFSSSSRLSCVASRAAAHASNSRSISHRLVRRQAVIGQVVCLTPEGSGS